MLVYQRVTPRPHPSNYQTLLRSMDGPRSIGSSPTCHNLKSPEKDIHTGADNWSCLAFHHPFLGEKLEPWLQIHDPWVKRGGLCFNFVFWLGEPPSWDFVTLTFESKDVECWSTSSESPKKGTSIWVLTDRPQTCWSLQSLVESFCCIKLMTFQRTSEPGNPEIIMFDYVCHLSSSVMFCHNILSGKL